MSQNPRLLPVPFVPFCGDRFFRLLLAARPPSCTGLWSPGLRRRASSTSAAAGSALAGTLGHLDDPDIAGRLWQLHPLSARQNLTHFQSHRRVDSFYIPPRLNDAIDLGVKSVSVNRLRFEQARELRFFLLQRFCARHDSVAVVLECPFDLCFLIVG